MGLKLNKKRDDFQLIGRKRVTILIFYIVEQKLHLGKRK